MYFSKPARWNSFITHPDRIASAENGRPDLFEKFKEENHLINWRPYYSGRKEPPPYHDHGRTYQMEYLDRTRQVHVFHVYVGHSKEYWDDIYMAMQAYANEHNKVAEIYDGSHSWYYYSEDGTGTAVIIIHDPDVHVKIP